MVSRGTGHDDEGILARREAVETPPDPSQYTVLRRLATAADHRFVMAFGGGAAAGICGNVALARLLEELGLKEHVEEVWGTSAGAIVGGGWASGTSAMEIFGLIRSLGGRRIDVCWWEILRGLLGRPFGGHLPDGLVRGRHFSDAIEAGLAVDNVEDCPIPFRCIACSDDGHARRKIFRRGPLLPAIFSSMTVPGVLMPHPEAERDPCGYYDGGVVEKTPLISPINEHARLNDPRKLLLLATHFGADAQQAAGRGFVRRFLQCIFSLEDLAWEHHLVEARQHDHVTVMALSQEIRGKGIFAFEKADSFYLQYREIYKKRLQDAEIALTLGAD